MKSMLTRARYMLRVIDRSQYPVTCKLPTVWIATSCKSYYIPVTRMRV